MRRLLILFTAILFIGCNSSKNKNQLAQQAKARPDDSASLLSQYWILQDADHPEGKDILNQLDDGITMQPGIVFMTDSTVLENPAGEMRYGRYDQTHSPITVKYDGGGEALYAILKLDSQHLWLERKENNSATTLKYKATDTWWPDSEKNPFSQKNYAWAKAPDQPETNAQILIRLKSDISFFAELFQGYINGSANTMNSIGIPNCFNWYQGGFTVQPASNLDPKWIKCFYDKKQALEGRQILENAITKKYHWDKDESNFMKQAAPVLRQMLDSLEVPTADTTN